MNDMNVKGFGLRVGSFFGFFFLNIEVLEKWLIPSCLFKEVDCRNKLSLGLNGILIYGLGPVVSTISVEFNCKLWNSQHPD